MQFKKPIIVVPMAGMGSRFSEAGYIDIKPLIPIHGRPMISHVIKSVGIEGDWVFIVQKEHRYKYHLDVILNNLCPGCTVIDTGGGATEGAACSLLLTKHIINNDRPLVVINSDNIIEWSPSQFHTELPHADGMILVFKDTNPKWSFVKLDDSNKYVVEVAEKNPISDLATAGMYIWRKGSDFVWAAEQMIAKNIRVNNEFYLCPTYNENIQAGQKIIVCNVNKMHGVGTPEDLEMYLKNNYENSCSYCR